MTTHTSLPPIEVGTRLTNYASLDLMVEGYAAGGYGLVVWGPNQANGGQTEALKLLRPDLLARANVHSAAEGERLRRDFEREALTWCHLWPDAGIIAANGLTRLPGWDNLPVLQLEYAPRGSLRQTLSEAHSSHTRHLALKAALAWGQQIAAALAVIHQPDPACERPDPLVHCDLKPENVLLNAQGWAMLTDLGLTRAYAAASTPTPSPAMPALGAQDAGDDGLLALDAHEGQRAHVRRVARLRAALQAVGHLPGSPAGELATTMRAATGGLATRSMRMPPLSAAQLTTLLAPRLTPPAPPLATPTPSVAPPANPEAVPAGAGVVGTATATEPGIGSRGPALGTPPYMPPEQWWGLDAVTPASDVYALGVLLFELFAGGRWSITQQRWLDDDDSPDDTAMRTTGERYVRFPHAPHFTDEAQAYLHGMGGVAGQQAYCAAWYAAHRAGPRWRLDDSAVGALTRGPLVDLAKQPEQAARMLQALNQLIAGCLEPEAAQRPTAADVQRRLGALARLAGEEPLVIPEVVSHTPVHEAIFWENLAITYSNIEHFDERLRLQQRVVTLDPEDPQRWMNLGNAFSDLERYEEALAAYAEAERWLTPAYQASEPERAERVAQSLANNQASALRALGRYEEAVATYRRLLALHPDRTNRRFNLAVTLLHWSREAGATREQQMERLRAARQEAQQVLTEAPGYTQGQALLSQIEQALARLGDM